jgi:broad specificity phosphatase PhoE
MPHQLWLIRHGETVWSLSGAHTGRTDLRLTPEGERKAAALGPYLAGHDFKLVLTSPMQRARRTCELAGLGAAASIDPNLSEWNYGDYEGLSTADIQRTRPGWSLFRDGVVNGESIEQVAVRARAVIERAAAANGDAALFAHGHILRILAACWLELPPASARYFFLGTAGVSALGYEHETRVIVRWNLQYPQTAPEPRAILPRLSESPAPA